MSPTAAAAFLLPSIVRYAWRAYQPGAPAEPLVRDWLATALDCEPVAVALVRDALGRPRLGASQRQFDVSWSHSGDGLLMALGDGVEIGADVERVKPRPRARALALARRFLASSEAEWLAAMPADAHSLAFVRLWCAKEAVLKAHGRGLAFGLDKLTFAEHHGALQLVECNRLLGRPGDWSLQEFEPEPGYRAALAWRPR